MATARSLRRAELDPARRAAWTLLGVCGATFMLLIDITIVQVALPTIEHHLHASFSDLQWIIDAYALSLASLILTAGSSADRFGRRTVFIAGLSLFTAASALCGLAGSVSLLIAARVVQGVGGAAMFATGLALIGQEFRGAARGKAVALWGSTVGGAVALGPLVGGVLTSGLGWRWIFLVNVPVGLATLWVACTRMANVGDPGARRLDLGGLVSFALAIFLFDYACIRSGADGWASPSILLLLGGGAVAGGAFLALERRQSEPMVDLALFTRARFSAAAFTTFAVGSGMFAMFPFLTIFLQDSLGYSPVAGGLRLLPSTLPAFVVPLVARAGVERRPPGVVLATGMFLTAAGLGAMCLVSSSSSWTALVLGLVLTGVGIGLVNPAIARVALAVVPPEKSGIASGLSNTFRIGGLATGVAILGSIFEGRLASSLRATLGLPSAPLARSIASEGLRALGIGPASGKLYLASRLAFVEAVHTLLFVGSVVVAAGGLVALVAIRGGELHVASTASSTAAEVTPVGRTASPEVAPPQ